MNFLRTTSTRRLIAGPALTVAVDRRRRRRRHGVQQRRRHRRPPKALDAAIHDALAAPKPAGVTARIRFTNNLISSGAAHHRLSAALGRERPALDLGTVACGSSCSRTRATRRSRSPTGACRSTTPRATPSTAPNVGSANSADAPARPRPRRAERRADLVRPPAAGRAGDRSRAPQPTTQAGQPAYKVSVTPKHDAGLLGQAEIAWDAANGIPLRIAVTAAGSSSPVLALEVTDISYGSVDSGALAVTPPAGAKVVDLGSPAHAGGKARRSRRRRRA